uniref:DUF2269 family protein n=1 Tax=Cohnella candidum TaxID=2674991 RepID=A0A3G3K5T2_9BACL|nr:DUF2269 family protein [Cohnella candidum]
MYDIMLFLHVVGAVGMGIYAILPFMAGQFRKLSGAAQEGLASGLVTGGRIGQFALVIQLLTGGYLISQGDTDYATSWMIVILVIFVAIGALTGIVQGPIRKIAAAAKEGRDASSFIGKVRTFSVIILVLFLVMLWIMTNPWA